MTKPPDIIVYSELDWRVRLIKDPPQWVIERKATPKSKTWDGKSWCQTREALIRFWNDRTGRPAPAYLRNLPERASMTLSAKDQMEISK